MQQAVTDLFHRYERQTNGALTGEPDLEALGELYDEAFIGACPSGVVTGKKDDAFRKALAAGFARNKEIGTRRMEVRDLRIEPIDEMHAIAHVSWRATYDVRGTQKTIDFTNAYLTRIANGRARVFGWITGDEEATLRKHGII